MIFVRSSSAYPIVKLSRFNLKGVYAMKLKRCLNCIHIKKLKGFKNYGYCNFYTDYVDFKGFCDNFQRGDKDTKAIKR